MFLLTFILKLLACCYTKCCCTFTVEIEAQDVIPKCVSLGSKYIEKLLSSLLPQLPIAVVHVCGDCLQ